MSASPVPQAVAGEGEVTAAAAELRRWPAEMLAERQRLNDRLGATLEQLVTTVRALCQQVGGRARG